MKYYRIVLLLSAGIALAASIVSAQKKTVTDEEVARVHRSILLIDTHNDLPTEVLKGRDIGVRNTKGHTDIPRLREGGVGAVFFAAWVSPSLVAKHQSAHRVLEEIDAIRHDMVEEHPSDLMLALRADDIVRARKQGKIAVLIGVEGGHAIEDSLRILRDCYALGARYMTLTHVNTNNWADSSGDIDNPKVKHHGGLTPFGRSVVREMNRLGMIVDVSHVSDKAFWDVLETSSVPVIASHSSCRAIADIPRNLTDEMIRALAGKGGVININFGCEFLSQASADTSTYIHPELKKKGVKMKPATLADVVAQISHVVKIAGIDAVGIGSDFDGVGCTPVGLKDVSQYPNLTRALLEHGYSEAEIRKIYGQNLLRVMRAVEQGAGIR